MLQPTLTKEYYLTNCKNIEEAMEFLDKAISIDPRKPNALFYKGIILGKIKKHEEALNCFEKVYKKNPSHLDALFHKGIELAEVRQT